MDKSGGVYRLYISNNEVCVSQAPIQQGGGKRKKIEGMTRKSSAAMRRFLNSVLFETATFVTLTYRYNLQNWKVAYANLRAWHKRLCALCGGVCVAWRQELQERGAIHFHCFVIDLPAAITAEVLRENWLAVTGQQGDTAARKYGVDIKTIDTLTRDDAGVICSYLVKYASKEGALSVGRQWGVLGRIHAKETGKKITLDDFDGEAIFEYLRRDGVAERTIDGGVRFARCYLGHIGTDSGNGVHAGIIQDVEKISGIIPLTVGATSGNVR